MLQKTLKHLKSFVICQFIVRTAQNSYTPKSTFIDVLHINTDRSFRVVRTYKNIVIST